jgi:hypothetical protein
LFRLALFVRPAPLLDRDDVGGPKPTIAASPWCRRERPAILLTEDDLAKEGLCLSLLCMPMPVARLINNLLNTIVADKLTAAVLDDAKTDA